MILNDAEREPAAADPVAVVADLDDGLVLPQVPHDRLPAGVGGGQDVLHLSVPGHDADVLSGLGGDRRRDGTRRVETRGETGTC